MGSGEAQGSLLVHLTAGAGVSEVTLIPHEEPEKTQDTFLKVFVAFFANKISTSTSGSLAATNPTDLVAFTKPKINFISFQGQIPGKLVSQRVLPALFHPGRQAGEAGRARHVVHKEHSMNVAIVVLHHGLSEALLPRRVPQLELGMERR